jgi:hypothetical protein
MPETVDDECRVRGPSHVTRQASPETDSPGNGTFNPPTQIAASGARSPLHTSASTAQPVPGLE